MSEASASFTPIRVAPKITESFQLPATATSHPETSTVQPSLAENLFQGAGVDAKVPRPTPTTSPTPETPPTPTAPPNAEARPHPEPAPIPPPKAETSKPQDSKTETTPPNQPDLEPSSFYQVLNLNPQDVTPQSLRDAFRTAATKWHPDHHMQDSPQDRDKAEEFFKRCTQAYDVLRDPNKRSKYDAQLKAAQATAKLTQEYADPDQIQSTKNQIEVISQNKALSLQEQNQLYTEALVKLGMGTQARFEANAPPAVKQVVNAILEAGAKSTRSEKNQTDEDRAQLMLMLILLLMSTLMSGIGTLGQAAGGNYEKAMESFFYATDSGKDLGTVLSGLIHNQTVDQVKDVLNPPVKVAFVAPAIALPANVPSSEPAASPPISAESTTATNITAEISPPSPSPEIAAPAPNPQLPPVTESTVDETIRTAMIGAIATSKIPTSTGVPASIPTQI